jgi:hypothetical protein
VRSEKISVGLNGNPNGTVFRKTWNYSLKITFRRDYFIFLRIEYIPDG